MFRPSKPINKRYTYLFIVVGAILVCALVLSFRNLAEGTHNPAYLQRAADLDAQYVRPAAAKHRAPSPGTHAAAGGAVLKGHAIAEKLGNETAKAELGRAAWKLFHTMFARFPDKPAPDESAALEAYVYLFQRLYPCGECAAHFGLILEEFPPQVSSRSAAAAWGCHVHNEVNKSLDKELFDCSNIGDFYDCGCKETPEGENVDDEEDGDVAAIRASGKKDTLSKKVEIRRKKNKWQPKGHILTAEGEKELFHESKPVELSSEDQHGDD